MAESDAEKLEGNKLGDSGLHQHIAHWAEVLDRWVKGIDTRLGRTDGASAGDADASPGPGH
ncbi:MAG TPA: hypothetical protein VGJ79_07385 [Candidatus Dormibacteraeota bacterium]|jgi:hypothetical protein